MNYPETALIVITSHGEIPITKDPITTENIPYIFIIPNEISTITKLSVVAPGVCNITNTEDVDDFVKTLMEKIKDPNEYNALLTDPINYLNLLVQINKEIEKEVVTQTINVKNTKEDDYDPTVHDEYVYHLNQRYNITQYKSDDEMLNKVYTRNNKTELNRSAWDHQMILVNAEGKPDLFTEINGKSFQDKNSELVFSNVVEFLKNKGVKNIILVDLSCSTFESEIAISKRDERSIRRGIFGKKLFGGKYRIKTHKNKSKRKYKTHSKTRTRKQNKLRNRKSRKSK
jgi:hypothetical protein